MVCSIIDECRCYAYSSVKDPKKTQFCGARRGPNIVSCPVECCAGGCPGQITGIEPRHPFRIIDRAQQDTLNIHIPFLILVAITIVLCIAFTT